LNGAGTLQAPAIRRLDDLELMPVTLGELFPGDSERTIYYYNRERAEEYQTDYPTLVAPFVAEEQAILAGDETARAAALWDVHQRAVCALAAHLVYRVKWPLASTPPLATDPPSFLLIESERALKRRRTPKLDMLTSPLFVGQKVLEAGNSPFWWAPWLATILEQMTPPTPSSEA
jgi:hypothetical protein